MKVAVVIANLNMEKTIGRAIVSARHQTHPVSEIIVVDGCSTDGSRDVARFHGATVIVDPQKGEGHARNVGIVSTDADFIVPLDADDWIDATYVEKCLLMCDPISPFGISHILPCRIGIIATQMMWPKGEIESPQPPFTLERLTQRNLLFSCSMFRRQAWADAGGYSEDWRIWEDWDFWLRVVERGWQIAVVEEPLFHFGHRNLGEMPEHLTIKQRAEWTMAVRSAHAQRMMKRVTA